MMLATLRGISFTLCLAVTATVSAATFTVTNTNNSGPGSLRQAMLDANLSPWHEADTIVFAIGSGQQTIRPLAPLPFVHGHITIDGTTQPGYTGTPLIEIDGSLEGGGSGGGIRLGTADVRALIINNFTATGLSVDARSTILGCYIGTNAAGTEARPNQVGIWVHGDLTPSFTTIGGTGPNDGNLISGNSWGVITNDNTAIDGNHFGTNAAGTAVLGSSTHLVVRSDRSSMSIGASAPNHFAGGTAIRLEQARYVTVVNNQIGFSKTGAEFPVSHGVSVWEGLELLVTNNTISASTTGVGLSGNTLRATVRQNSIRGQGFALDLSNFSGFLHTPNDAGDADTGPNNYINHPDISKAVSLNGVTSITGTYSGAANRNITLDFYQSNNCHSSGYGPGATWLGSAGVTTDAAGNASFKVDFAASTPAGRVITATATNSFEGTSEFSACAMVEGHGRFSFTGGFASGTEGGSVTVTVQRTAGSAGTATVSYAATDGKAKAPADYAPVSGTMSFADGETSKPFQVALPDDAVYEGQEQFTLTLSNPTGAFLGTPTSMQVTINDNDPPPHLLTSSPIDVKEGNSGITVVSVPVVLSAAVGVPVTFSYFTFNDDAQAGQDYVHAAGTVTFAAGETQKNVSISIQGDTIHEHNESFGVYFILTGVGTYTIRVRITDDDTAPTISVESVRVVERDSNHIIEVPITATSKISGVVYLEIVPQSAALVADYVPLEYYAIFNNETKAMLRVRIVGDDETEPDETFTVRIAFTYAAAEIGQERATVAILNDDAGVGPAEQSVPLGGGGPIAIDIGQPLPHPVAIALASSDPATVSVPAQVVIPAGKSSALVDARALEAPGSATVTVTMPPELEGDVFTLRVRTYTPATLVFDPDPLHLHVGQTATVRVTLDPPSPNELTIALAAESNVAVPRSVVIPAGGSGTFTVEAKQAGPIHVRARLPRSLGDRDVLLFGQVTETPASPTILRISPPDGASAGGTTVELEGVNFVRDCALSFGGAPATSVQFVTATLMTAITPAHDPGTVDVVLTCGGQSSTFARGFTFTDAAPRLSHVAPSTGNVAGGTFVRIAGANLRSSCWPFFDGVAAPSASLESPSSMLAVTPPHDANAVDVLLRCTGGEALVEDAFFYTVAEEPAASIMTVTPLAAAPGEEVTILGTRFRPTDRVAFSMPLATIVRSAPDKHVVLVPEVNAQRYSIDVMDISGRATTTGPIFTVLEATRPRITAVAPQSAPAGAEIELHGEGFRPGYTFTVAGQPATVVWSSYTRAIVRLAGGIAPGQYEVNVINAAGNTASIGPKIDVAANGLSITGISAGCTTTSGGGAITIKGTGFEGAMIVTFGSNAATSVTIVDDSTLTATIPAGEAGPAQLRIVRGDGAVATYTGAFRYVSPFDPNGCGGAPTRGRSVRH